MPPVSEVPCAHQCDRFFRAVGDAETTVAEVPARHWARLGDLDPLEAAGDLAAIARGLIDEAGARGAGDVAGLNRRVLRAVLSYLLGSARPLGAARRRPRAAA